jgi:hypothetical protein
MYLAFVLSGMQLWEVKCKYDNALPDRISVRHLRDREISEGRSPREDRSF